MKRIKEIECATYDRNTVTTLTVVTVKGDVGATVHGKTVIVVVHLGTGDGNVRGGADIKGIGVVAKRVLGSTFRIKKEKEERTKC